MSVGMWGLFQGAAQVVLVVQDDCCRCHSNWIFARRNHFNAFDFNFRHISNLYSVIAFCPIPPIRNRCFLGGWASPFRRQVRICSQSCFGDIDLKIGFAQIVIAFWATEQKSNFVSGTWPTYFNSCSLNYFYICAIKSWKNLQG